MVDMTTLALAVSITAVIGMAGAHFAYRAGRQDADHVPILKPVEDADFGIDVYIVTVAYQPSGREQTLVLVDTNDLSKADVEAYIMDTVDDVSIRGIEHVQAYQVDDRYDPGGDDTDD